MNGTIYLQWHYLVFLAPAGASALMLILSNMRLGGRGGHRHGRHGAKPGVGGHGPKHTHATAKPSAHRATGAKRNATAPDAPLTQGAAEFLLALVGFQRIPPLIFLQMFFLWGGLAGFWANRWLFPAGNIPTFLQWLPCLGIAVGTGLLCARFSAELIARLMPRDASSVVTRDGLIGLTGKVVFPITETAGRVHIYDEFGTLHDEMCRVQPGHAAIERGSFARIVDRDVSGKFLVEEAAEPIRFR